MATAGKEETNRVSRLGLVPKPLFCPLHMRLYPSRPPTRLSKWPLDHLAAESIVFTSPPHSAPPLDTIGDASSLSSGLSGLPGCLRGAGPATASGRPGAQIASASSRHRPIQGPFSSLGLPCWPPT